MVSWAKPQDGDCVLRLMRGRGRGRATAHRGRGRAGAEVAEASEVPEQPPAAAQKRQDPPPDSTDTKPKAAKREKAPAESAVHWQVCEVTVRRPSLLLRDPDCLSLTGAVRRKHLAGCWPCLDIRV